MAIMMFCGTLCFGKNTNDTLCLSSCGHIHRITSPFRLTTDPPSCGDLRYSLSCENNITVLLWHVGYDYKKYYVQAINYNNYTIRLVDPDIQRDDCSSIPQKGLSVSEIAVTRDHVSYETEIRRGLKYANHYLELTSFKEVRRLSRNVIFFNCGRPVMNHSYIGAAPCVFKSNLSLEQYYSYYYVFDDHFKVNEFEESCGVVQIALIANTGDNNQRIDKAEDVQDALAYGFELSWLQSFTDTDEKLCYVDGKDSNTVHCSSSCIFPDDRVVLNQCGKH